MTLSYYEAGRWLDAQETVEQVPAPADVVDWLRAFVEEHYVVEPEAPEAAREFPAAGGSLRQRRRACRPRRSAAGSGDV